MDVFESGGKLITTAAKAVLLVVTGIMTWQFLYYVMGPDKWLFAALGLVAFEVGLYAWPYLYQNDAVTTGQEMVAAIMTVVCWVGIAIAFIGEVMRYNTQAAALLTQIQPVMPYFIMAIVVLNVGAYIMFPAMSPEAANKRANKRAAFAQQKADTLRTAAQADLIIAQAHNDVRGMKAGSNGIASAGNGDDFLPTSAGSGTQQTRGKSMLDRLFEWRDSKAEQRASESARLEQRLATLMAQMEEMRNQQQPQQPPQQE